MNMTFNQLFLTNLCTISKMETDDALRYIGKSPNNRTNFYRYNSFSLEPMYWIKPMVLEALGKTVAEWAIKTGQQREVPFDWGV